MRAAILVLNIATVVIMILAPLGHGIPDQSPKGVEEWFENLPHAKPKLTKLHFFIHDVFSGPNQSIVTVAQANITANSPTSFGRVNVLDDRLTARPEYGSKLIARFQGLNAADSRESLSFLVALTFVFEGGSRYNGSTLSVLGRISESELYREFPIVGGTGDFRLAQGIITATVYSVDRATRNQVVECHAIALHYEF